MQHCKRLLNLSLLRFHLLPLTALLSMVIHPMAALSTPRLPQPPPC